MSKRGPRRITEGGIKFTLREYVNKKRKAKIEKHPQAKDNFRFRKSGVTGNFFAWFTRTQPHGASIPSKHKNTSLFEK